MAISNRDSKTKDIGHRHRNLNKEDNRRYKSTIYNRQSLKREISRHKDNTYMSQQRQNKDGQEAIGAGNSKEEI